MASQLRLHFIYFDFKQLGLDTRLPSSAVQPYFACLGYGATSQKVFIMFEVNSVNNSSDPCGRGNIVIIRQFREPFLGM